MKNVMVTASIIAMGTSGAYAGGIERSTQSVGVLFEKGSYAELTFGQFSPDVSGNGAGPFTGLSSGDMAGSYSSIGLAYKQALTDHIDMALILDQPIGADVMYPVANAPYPFAGSNAEVRSSALTALLRYRTESNLSVYGGLRVERVEGNVQIIAPALMPAFTNYRMTGEADTALGYVIGVAWEKPEIAARVALTYNSKIDHTLDTVELGLAPVALNGTMDVEVPASLNLEFQTGVAKDTLFFGSIRWVDWSKFNITPPVLNTAIVSYSSDTVSYNIGVGHRFNEQWSGAVTLGYEGSDGTRVGNLGPTDGYKSVGLAATYTHDNLKITGGVRYVDIGDAVTSTIGSRFTDNSGVGFGLRIGYSF
ncbi:MAG TPA: outer membrane protein transport protein [Paracoccaceae bacterium]|nr:outer membrane protein transport protein [Paracoccaceae bacterium]